MSDELTRYQKPPSDSGRTPPGPESPKGDPSQRAERGPLSPAPESAAGKGDKARVEAALGLAPADGKTPGPQQPRVEGKSDEERVKNALPDSAKPDGPKEGRPGELRLPAGQAPEGAVAKAASDAVPKDLTKLTPQQAMDKYNMSEKEYARLVGGKPLPIGSRDFFTMSQKDFTTKYGISDKQYGDLKQIAKDIPQVTKDFLTKSPNDFCKQYGFAQKDYAAVGKALTQGVGDLNPGSRAAAGSKELVIDGKGQTWEKGELRKAEGRAGLKTLGESGFAGVAYGLASMVTNNPDTRMAAAKVGAMVEGVAGLADKPANVVKGNAAARPVGPDRPAILGSPPRGERPPLPGSEKAGSGASATVDPSARSVRPGVSLGASRTTESRVGDSGAGRPPKPEVSTPSKDTVNPFAKTEPGTKPADGRVPTSEPAKPPAGAKPAKGDTAPLPKSEPAAKAPAEGKAPTSEPAAEPPAGGKSPKGDTAPLPKSEPAAKPPADGKAPTGEPAKTAADGKSPKADTSTPPKDGKSPLAQTDSGAEPADGKPPASEPPKPRLLSPEEFVALQKKLDAVPYNQPRPEALAQEKEAHLEAKRNMSPQEHAAYDKAVADYERKFTKTPAEPAAKRPPVDPARARTIAGFPSKEAVKSPASERPGSRRPVAEAREHYKRTGVQLEAVNNELHKLEAAGKARDKNGDSTPEYSRLRSEHHRVIKERGELISVPHELKLARREMAKMEQSGKAFDRNGNPTEGYKHLQDQVRGYGARMERLEHNADREWGGAKGLTQPMPATDAPFAPKGHTQRNQTFIDTAPMAQRPGPTEKPK